MFHGGGRMVVNAGDRKTGAGHFGRTIIDEGVEIASFHWEADFDLSGRSVLAVRPLLWRNGWPVAGEHFKGGTFAIESERRGYSLEIAVDFQRMQQERQGWFNRQQMQQPVKPIPTQTLEEVIGSWPKDNIAVRCSDYMFRPHQHWSVTPVDEAGGYLSNPYFKITIAGTDRALTATANKELITLPAYTGGDEQLWRIEQLTDGTFRIMPKRIPGEEGINTRYCIYSASDSTPTLAEYDFQSDNSKWNFRISK
jgi:arabinan endo-1,5-alpha-L-arabinosidase